MKLISMFKTPKNRSFNFKPRYYNAEKEAFEQRINALKNVDSTVSSDVEMLKQRVRDQFQNKRNSRNLSSSKKSNIRIVIIIAILSALSFWLLK